jgi:hypothetical protein
LETVLKLESVLPVDNLVAMALDKTEVREFSSPVEEPLPA